MTADGLAELEQQVARDLRLTAYPHVEWVPPRIVRGQRVLDVLIVGAGQGGLAVAAELLRERIPNILVVDEAEEGAEGLWTRYARMPTLRTAKTVTGPDTGIPSLTFQAWYEAQHGADAFERLFKITKEDWNRYLAWFRRVLQIPVRNRARFAGVTAGDGHLRILLETPSGDETVLVRKLVLAGGIESSGRWWMPPEIARLPAALRAHTAEPIDFASLRGRHVAVIGAGASAFDNAATALEAGATVTLLCRRPELQRVQPYKIIAFPGFLRHFGSLDDATRWRMMRYLLSIREALTLETWNRATGQAGFSLLTGVPVRNAMLRDGRAVLETPAGEVVADYVICGTGLEIDLGLRPELAAVAPHVATWRDRYAPPEAERDDRIAGYPYLGPGMQFVPRVAEASWLSDIHCFNFGATLSMGPSGSSISGMKYAAPRVAHGISADLFAADFPTHEAAILSYQTPEFPEALARDAAAARVL